MNEIIGLIIFGLIIVFFVIPVSGAAMYEQGDAPSYWKCFPAGIFFWLFAGVIISILGLIIWAAMVVFS